MNEVATPAQDSQSVGREKRAELLFDHYKDTFQMTMEYSKSRNRYFALILIAIALMLFQLTSPGIMERLANSYLRNQLGESAQAQKPSDQAVSSPQANEDGPVDFRFITSLLWFVLTCLLVQYYQRSAIVNRQYKYLHKLEEALNKLLGEAAITREGAAYLDHIPTVLRRVRFLYEGVFPILLMAVIVAKLVREIVAAIGERTVTAIIFTVVDIALAFVICYYTILYYQWRDVR